MGRSSAEFDIIFAGGGTAACLIAGRLAAADPSLRILVLEAGPHTFEDPVHLQPGRAASHLGPASKAMKFITSNPSPHLDGRSPIVPSPHCVGGGSSINFVLYNRASASEFDDWEVKCKNPGWGSHHLIPLLKKTETYEPDPYAETHGSSGPLKVSYDKQIPRVVSDLLDIAPKYDKLRTLTDDMNDTVTVNAYGRWPKWVSGSSGRRSDVAHHFIYSQKHNRNLTVLAGYVVKRIIISHGVAVGVEYVPNPQVHPDEPAISTSAHADKLVVVSGGAFGSPLMLERSGIGAASVLQQYGINEVVDLPGVGERYQDHPNAIATCRASDDAETIDALMRGESDVVDKWHAQWLKDGSGMMTRNGLEAGMKYRPTKAEVKAIGPAFEKKWKAYYADAPDKAVMWFGSSSFGFGVDMKTAPKSNYFGTGFYIGHPSSFGRVHITSGYDAFARPDFSSGFLEAEEDMELLVFAYKRSRELSRRMACYRGEFPPRHPEFAKDSPAAVSEVPYPVPIDAPDFEYTEEDNEAIRVFARKIVNSTWHSLGTCAMMPREDGGVVDPRLNVYGVRGLKVADLSIAPMNVGSNTYSTALVIAEKAALIIAEDLGIIGV